MSNEYLNNKFLEAAINKFHQSEQDQVKYQLIIDDLKSSLEKRGKNKALIQHDLDFYVEAYKKAKNEHVDSKNELAFAFQTLSEHLVRYAKDIITDVDDAIQEGVMICFQKILYHFRPERGRAFNYMTTCILNHYRQIYRTHKNQKLLLERFKEVLLNRQGNVVIKNGKEIYSYDD